MLFFQEVFLFLHYLIQLLKRIESIYLTFFGRIYCCCFVFYPIRRTCVWSISFKIFLWHLQHNKWTQSKIKSLPPIDVSNLILYLKRSDWKSSSVTLSALLLIMITMLNAFYVECLLNASSFWMHYTLSIIVVRRNKISCYCWLNFTHIRFFEITYDAF